MSGELSATLASLANPVTLAVALGLLGALLAILDRLEAAAVWTLAGAVWLWAASTPVVSGALRASLEDRFPSQAPADAPRADVIVLLGGILTVPAAPGAGPDLSDAVDRVVHAARLYRAGKAGKVLVSGGGLSPAGESDPESVHVAALLEEWGVAREDILVETDSRTTYENAVFSKLMADEHGFGKALLVTSAMHMPRALGTFRRAGMRAAAAATDRTTGPAYRPPGSRWLPDAQALAGTSAALREYLALALYRARRWM